jgi:four helix bundle protein
MNNFRELKVWQKARAIVKDVYGLTISFPDDEKYALTSQIKRASVSISSNIAEGSGRNTDADFAKFLDISLGSCYEIENDFILASDLLFISKNELKTITDKIQEIERMLIGLMNSLRKK